MLAFIIYKFCIKFNEKKFRNRYAMSSIKNIKVAEVSK